MQVQRRRQKSDSGDIDVLITGSSKAIYDVFIDSLIKSDILIETLARGDTKYMGLAKHKSLSNIARRIDIMYTTRKEYPYAVLYFTGSADFNPKMRKIALDMGYSLNEHSLTNTTTKEKLDIQFESEKDIFKFLNMDYVEPQNR